MKCVENVKTMLKIFVSFFFLLLVQATFAQSIEQGSAFNKFMSAEDGVNLLSGTAAFKKTLTTISSGLASYDIELNYSSNVEEIVRNKNDIAPSSWVGLGWNLGHAKIISDDAGSMFLDDDSYYMQAAAGMKYKIIKDDKEKDKWWIEGLPYWTIKPVIQNVTFTRNGFSKTYRIIIGWEVFNDNGVKFVYGDMEYKEGKSRGSEDNQDPSVYMPKRNATEYTIANPYSFGFVGVYENGDAVLYPNAWNLARMEDYNGNYLTFTYEQYEERVKKTMTSDVDAYETKVGYTKESYIKTVTSSQGGSIEFITEPKNFEREFIDNIGVSEDNVNSEPDWYIDPMERRFLSKIKVYGKDGFVVRFFDFCYEELKVRINGSYNQDYSKRLLASIVETSGVSSEEDNKNGVAEKKHAGEEVQKESFRYVKEDVDVNGRPMPLGAIDSIIGPNCGVVKYEYKEMSLTNLDDATGLNKTSEWLQNIAIGKLEDGTVYIVGIDKVYGKAKVMLDKNGSRNDRGTQDLVDGKDGEFFIGDKNWFVYRDGKENGTYYPFVWNGEEWKMGRTFKDNGSHDKAIVGPGYILAAHIAKNKIKLTIPWAIWAKDTQVDLFSVEIDNVDDDKNDRDDYVKLLATKNHFGIFYKREWRMNDGEIQIYSFVSEADKKTAENTLTLTYGDENNQYDFFDDNTFIEIEQGGIFSNYGVNAWYWRDDNDAYVNDPDRREKCNKDYRCLNPCKGNWCRVELAELPGVQGTASVQSMGDNYVVIRHNDYDNMTILEYDGQNWGVPDGYSNVNMVHDQNVDFWDEAMWDASSGYNFFVARMPRIRKRWWRNNEIKPFREYERIERVNGYWKRGDIESSGDEKIVYVGPDWYFIKNNQIGFIRNGFNWTLEDYSKNLKGENSKFLRSDKDNYSVLNGEYFAEKYDDPHSTLLYYKKSDSFKSSAKGFFVKKKYVKDPVVNKVVKFKYDYTGGVTRINYTTWSSFYYNVLTKSAVISSYTITLPDGAGTVQKKLCAGVALGNVCEEMYFDQPLEFYNNSVAKNPVKTVTREYKRYRDPSWPKLLYSDRVVSQTSIEKNVMKVEYYTYADGTNGLISSVRYEDRNNSSFNSENVNVYAVEKYPELKNSNRLTEKGATYQCIPSCGATNSKIISGNAVTYSKYDNLGNLVPSARQNYVLREYAEWTYTPKNSRDNAFSFDWTPLAKNESWTNTKQNLKYHKGSVCESVDLLGIKDAIIYDKNKENEPIAAVTNAGLEEVLVLPGYECSSENWPDCYIKNLKGRALGKDYFGLNSLYGRFAKDAILVNKDKKLKGTLKKAKNSKYRFSAWVQGTSVSANTDKININVNSSNKEFALKGNGEWEYIEWETETELKEQSYTLTLSTSNNNEIHLQDIRFVPVDAQVSVTFWEDHLGLPIAKSDDRSIGSYIEYDAAGRAIETYVETADGSIVLKSSTSYYPSVCAVSSDKSFALKELVVNGEKLAVSETPGEIEIAVRNSTDELKISWASYVDGEKVFYSLHKTGEPANYDKDCCTGTSGITKEFEGNSMTLNIAVSSLEKPYTVKINKSTSGWIDYGKPLTEGFYPNYLTNNNVSGVRYLTKKGIRKVVFAQPDWSRNEEEKETGDFVSIGGSINNGVDYIFALPNYVGKYHGNNVYTEDQNAKGIKNSFANADTYTWDHMAAFDNAGVKSEKYRMTTSVDNLTYVLYDRHEYTENPSDPNNPLRKTYSEHSSLTVKKLNGNSWESMGAVEETSVKDADIATAMASGKSGVPYVAYVGKSPNYSVSITYWHDPNRIEDVVDEPFENPEGSGLEKEVGVDHPVVVLVKHYDENKKKWVGFSSENGDLLKLTNGDYLPNAKKVKLASDGRNLYMALLYNNALSSQYALKVYKLTESGSQLNFTELVDQSFNSAIITYIEDNNHFDLAVYNDIPYVSFVNSANKDHITVVKYEQNLWRSVGSPAFANVSQQENSADLAVDGTPYVVVREGNTSSNLKRRNVIVPLMYSSKGDMDLTIASIGKIAETSLSDDFRQYILNYRLSVPMTMKKIPFDISFSDEKNVNGISVENNGEIVYTCKKKRESLFMMYAGLVGSDVSKFDIPLKVGENEIKIHIYGSEDNVSQIYTFSVYREYVSEFDFGSKTLGQDDGELVPKDSKYVTNSSSSSFIGSSDDNYNAGNEFKTSSSSRKSSVTSVETFDYEIKPPKDGSSSKTLCPQVNSAWYMLIDGLLFTQPVCFVYDFEKGEIVLSSSSGNGDYPVGSSSSMKRSSSSVKGDQIIFIDKDGNKKVIDIVAVRPTSSSGSSSSSSILNISSSTSSSSSMSSSSSTNSSLSSSSSYTLSSSSREYIEGTVIPKDYTSLYRYKFVAESNISFENKVSVVSGDYVANDVNVAANAQIQGNVLCSGDMSLNSNAYVYSITLGGSLNTQTGASYGSMQQQSVVVPYISRMIFNVGPESINVWAGQMMTLSPGDYGDVTIYTNARVYFEPGVYRFNSLYIAPNVDVKSSVDNALLQIWVRNNIRIDDNSSFMVDHNPKQVLVYGNGFFDMYIGVRTKMSATIVYPNGRVNISPYTEYSGIIWANSINVGANTTIK